MNSRPTRGLVELTLKSAGFGNSGKFQRQQNRQKKLLRLQRRFAIHLNGRKLASRWTVALTRVGGLARSAPARAGTILGGDKRVSSLTTTRDRFLVARFAKDNFSTIGVCFFWGYPVVWFVPTMCFQSLAFRLYPTESKCVCLDETREQKK